MKFKGLFVVSGTFLMLANLAVAQIKTSEASLSGLYPGKSYSPHAQRAFPSRPLWGDTHLHTALSVDAGLFGARLGLEEAYRFARGEEVTSSTGQPVKLLMSSQDVIHSFFVPDFRVKMDVLPNRYTITWFEALNVGEYDIYCTEYCGKGHSEMLGKVMVLSKEDYALWLEKAAIDIPEGVSLEEAGAELYQTKACITCHSIDGKPGVAPSFLGLFGSSEKLTDGSEVIVDENYIRESMLNPQAKVTLGYQPVMPTFQGVLKDRQIDALIAYIKSLKQ